MLPRSAGSSLQTSLFFINNILSTTPPDHLPYLVPSLVDAIGDYKDAFSISQTSESAAPLHKYKTTISALLHGKSVGGRWVAVAMIKCTVEAGQWEILRDCTSWVRGLLTILGKQDPPATKSLCILTLTRIYVLNRSYPTLAREISTPTLPSFVTSCLDLIAATTSSTSDKGDTDALNPLLEPVLYAFYQLLSQYPTIFRPFGARIQGTLLSLLAATSPSNTGQTTPHKISNGLASPQVIYLSRQVFVHLHFCAPKNASDREWAAAYGAVIADLHMAADHVFRSVVEKWNGVGHRPREADSMSSGILLEMGKSAMGLPSWTGILAGVERLTGLLDLLRHFYLEPTTSAVSLPLGVTIGLLSRIFDIHFPSMERIERYEGVQFRPEFVKEERDGLCAGLPSIHIAAMGIVLAMIERLGSLFLPIAQGIMEQIVWIFNSTSKNIRIRTATYSTVAKILGVAGLSLPKSLASPLSVMIIQCCKDILPKVPTTGNDQTRHDSRNGQQRNTSNTAVSSTNADAYLGLRASPTSNPFKFSKELSDLHQSAWTLLPVLISHLQPDYIELSVRAQIDRTAVVTQHKGAMTASVLQPPRVENGRKALSSIMPHMARAFGQDLDIEGLVRPRMPIVNALVYATGAANDLEMSTEPEAMDLSNEDPNIHNNELGSKVDEAHSQGHGQRDTSPTSRDNAQVVLQQQDAHNQTTDLSGQIEYPRKRPANNTMNHTSPVPATSMAQADTPSTPSFAALPPTENSPPSKRPRLTTEDAPIRTKTTSNEHASTRSKEQAHIVPVTAVGTPRISADKMAKGPLGLPREQQQDQEDSDDSFEIPELVLDADTDEEEEGESDIDKEDGER